jgi:hypothetical protein
MPTGMTAVGWHGLAELGRGRVADRFSDGGLDYWHTPRLKPWATHPGVTGGSVHRKIEKPEPSEE